MRFIWSSVIRSPVIRESLTEASSTCTYLATASLPGSSAALLAVDAGKGMWGEALDLQACAQWYIDHGPFFEVIILADCCRSRYRDVSLPGVNFDKYDAAVRLKRRTSQLRTPRRRALSPSKGVSIRTSLEAALRRHSYTPSITRSILAAASWRESEPRRASQEDS